MLILKTTIDHKLQKTKKKTKTKKTKQNCRVIGTLRSGTKTVLQNLGHFLNILSLLEQNRQGTR